MSSIHSIPADSHRTLDEHSKAKLQQAVKDFEAIFIGYLLKEMRSSVPKSDLFGESFGGDVVESMFDSELAKHVTRSGNIGLARILYRQITGEDLPVELRPRRIHTDPPAVPERYSGTPVEGAGRAGGPAPAVKEPPKDSPFAERLRPYEPIIQEAAETHGIDANLIRAVIVSESAANPDARSVKNAKGLMQLTDSTATALGVRNVWNPRENILGGSKYLKQLMERNGGDLTRALASYNAGPTAVERYGGIPPYEETRKYVERTLRYLKHFQELDRVSTDGS